LPMDTSLAQMLEEIAGRRVLVAGELFMQHLVHGSMAGIASHSPIPRLQVLRQDYVPGGVGAVARMLRIAGANVAIAGVVGDDHTGRMLLNRLAAEEIDIQAVISDPNTETATVTDVTAVDESKGRHAVLQLVTPAEDTVDEESRRQLLAAAEKAAQDAELVVVVEGEGPCVQALITHLRDIAGTRNIELLSVEPDQASRPVDADASKLKSLNELLWLVQQVRDRGGTIVFTNGCFDLLHAGHVNYLQAAAENGDFFILALNGDESVRTLKGPGRPVLSEQERIMVLSGLTCIDAITVFGTEDVCPLLEALKPEVYVKGGDYTIDTINQAERRLVEGYGGQVVLIAGEEGASTTNILRKIHEDDLQ